MQDIVLDSFLNKECENNDAAAKGSFPTPEDNSSLTSPITNRVLSLVSQHENLTISRIYEAACNLGAVLEVDLSSNFSLPKKNWSPLLRNLIVDLPRLTTLDLKNNGIGSENAIQLFRLLYEHCKHLVYIDVSDNNLEDESMEAVPPLLTDRSLEVLVLSNNHLTSCGVVELNKGVEKNSSLTELALGGNELGNMGVLALAQTALSHPSLSVLDLRNNHIGDYGAVCLAYEMENRQTTSALLQLNLANNDIGDEGLEAISEALRCSASRLVRLDLGRNSRITESGRRAFTGSASTWRCLQYLDLTCCNLDEKDGHSLAHAISQSQCSLKEVVVDSNNQLSPQAIETIELAMERKGTRWWRGPDFRSFARDANVYMGLTISFIFVTSFFVISKKCFPASRFRRSS